VLRCVLIIDKESVMERWIVSEWHNSNPNNDEVVFEGSKDHCREHASDLLKNLPESMDCMAMSEQDWKFCKGLSA